MVLAAMSAATVTMMVSCGYGEDIDQANERISKLTERVTSLEVEMAKANGSIAALQTLVEALSSAEYVTGVEETSGGYVLTFRSGKTATITDGKDGHSPLVGVRKDTDGVWYWTLDGQWLTDNQGQKVRADGAKGDQGAQGVQGEQGKQGEQGNQGEQGPQGLTPQLRINSESNEWEVSLDEGKTWTSTGVKATGENGDAFFKSVDVGDDTIVITLVDGTSMELPLFDTFKKIRDRVQSIVYRPDYSDGMIAVEDGKEVTMSYVVMPELMAKVIADNSDKLSLVGTALQTRAEGATLTVSEATGDAVTGVLTVKATPSGFEAGRYYGFALRFSDGVSTYQTSYTNAFLTVQAESIAIGIVGMQAGMGTVRLGEYVQLFVVWTPSYVTNRRVVWSSSDNSRATVDGDGLVSIAGNAPDGHVTITARSDNGKTASIDLVIADGRISLDTSQLKQSEAE